MSATESLSSVLWCQGPLQVPILRPGKAEEYGPIPWDSVTSQETRKKLLIFDLLDSSFCSHLGNELKDGRPFPFICSALCISTFQIQNKAEKKKEVSTIWNA